MQRLLEKKYVSDTKGTAHGSVHRYYGCWSSPGIDLMLNLPIRPTSADILAAGFARQLVTSHCRPQCLGRLQPKSATKVMISCQFTWQQLGSWLPCLWHCMLSSHQKHWGMRNFGYHHYTLVLGEGRHHVQVRNSASPKNWACEKLVGDYVWHFCYQNIYICIEAHAKKANLLSHDRYSVWSHIFHYA